MRRVCLLVSGLGTLLVAGSVWATTHHTITVNGTLADFDADEKTAGDPANDSTYGVDNELTTLYVTWDAQKLYLGFDYKVQGGAIMYLVDTGKSGGVTNLCAAGGYTGAFPANVQGSNFNLMIGFYANQSTPTTKPSVYVYTMASNKTTDITTATGVEVALTETVNVDKRTGSVEVGVPWDALYGLGAGKVQAGAQLKIYGVLRGKNDGDGLGDISPNPNNPVKNTACGGSDSNYLDNAFQEDIDTNGDGSPELGWSPGTNTPSSPSDAKITKDAAPSKDSKTTKPDGKVSTGDGAVTGDKGPTTDAKPKADLNKKAPTKDSGCACSAPGSSGPDLATAALALALLAATLLARRRRAR
jgi:MYXO-CTERM domain-containing protein